MKEHFVMNRRRLKSPIVGAALILFIAPNVFAQSAPSWAKFKRVRYIRSETRRDRKLEKAILQTLPDYSEEIHRIRDCSRSVESSYLVRYFYNRVDLNGDGIPETLVWLHSALIGGTSGYTAQIYQSFRGEYRLLWEGSPAWNPIIVSERRTKGWRNLIMLVAGGGVLPGYWMEIHFNGKGYPADPRDGDEIRKSRVVGREFIADDWWTGFRGILLRPAT